MKSIWRILRHNQSLVIGLILCTVVVAWAFGCESTVRSILLPSQKVNRPELQQEVESLIAQAELRFNSLDQQDAFKNALFEMAIQYSNGSNVNPVAVAVTLGNILGIGAIIDNRRKDILIKTLKGAISNGQTKTSTQREDAPGPQPS